MGAGRDPMPGLSSPSLRQLLLLRVAALGGLLAGAVANRLALGAPLPVLPTAVVIAAVAAITALAWWRHRPEGAAGQRMVVGQLLVDVVALTLLLWLTGGSSNPFAPLYLLPVTVAAAALRPLQTWLVAGAAAAGYTALMFLPQGGHPLPHGDHRFAGHLWGMWFGFLLAAGLVALFVARIGRALRARDQALAEARERALEAGRLLALGTLAAGTAHELGTPLATMAVLAGELRDELGADASVARRLDLLRSQIDRCKETLARMATHAGEAPAGGGRALPLPQYLDEVLDEWRRLRPQARVSIQLDGAGSPLVVADRTLTQAIVNVLNNAADASGADDALVEVRARWDAGALDLAVRDHGPGLSPALAGQIGNAFVSTKEPGRGMGLGLYLARLTLARLGGEIELQNAPGDGALARIRLPLARLAAVRPA